MFEKGDYIVYGNTGVCEVEDITSPEMKGVGNRLYYVLTPCFQKGNRIFTPVDSDKVVIRAIMTKEEALALIDKIPEIEVFWEKEDKLLERQYKESIRSCVPQEWVRIIKTSYLRQEERRAQGKKTTTVDERYFRSAEEYLYAEFAISLNMSREEVKLYIIKRMEQKENETINNLPV